MLVVYKSHSGGIVFNLGNKTLKLSGYGLVDNVDSELYNEAKKRFDFIEKWEKQGLIEVNQNQRKDDESFKEAQKKQDETITATDKKSGVKVNRGKKA